VDPPGLHALLPFLPEAPDAPPARIDLASLQAALPSGMTWIPAGTPTHSGEAGPAFLASTQPVTNFEFAEWLDALPPAARPAHLPSRGFVRDPSDSSRFLADAAFADRPVRGLAPASMRAYASWRGEAEGLELDLPRPAEFQRMAGAAWADVPGAHLLLPFTGGTAGRAAFRRGADEPQAWRDTDESCWGVRRLFSSGGEVLVFPPAAPGDPPAYVVAAEHGIVPLPTALERLTPIAPDARDHAYCFRLVHRPAGD